MAVDVGKFYAHNHFWEFENEYPDPVTGELKTGWQVVVENTDPFTISGTLPIDLAPGSYSLEVRGLLGGTAATTAAVVIAAPPVVTPTPTPTPSPTATRGPARALAATGSDAATAPLAIGALLLVGAGAAVFGINARRRAKVD